MDELIGKTLGQYRIETKIGSGGMATVFKAYQLSLDRHVAIKVLPPSFASQNPIFVERFQREAKAIARLNHPNILPVYDFGIDHDYSYIVMRYVEGAQTLGQIIPYSLRTEWIVYLISQVANALTYAHHRGVVHRDVKPSNILLDGEWVLLSDFGLAKVEQTATHLTDNGKSIGTPAYMSPEQARGEEVDHRSDIYSLGVILYEMLTHQIPHDAPTPLGIMLKRTTQPPPSPRSVNPAIPVSLEKIILRTLSLKPEDRYDSAADCMLDLKQAFADTPEGILAEKQTFVIDPPAFVRPTAKKDSHFQKWKTLWHNPVWPATIGFVMAMLAFILLGGNWSTITPTPTSLSQTVPAVAVVPTATETPTVIPSPTSTPTPPPTLTDTPLPPTDTPTITPTEPPVVTTLIIMVVTATATDTPPPTATPSPSNTPTVVPSLTPTATPNLPKGQFTLLAPLSLEEPSYGPTTFEWEWNGPVPADFAFEVRVWREGEPPTGAHDALLDQREGRIERISDNRYRLKLDIRQAAGVRDRTGIYLWTVVLVQLDPAYTDYGLQAQPTRLRFEAGGKDNGKDGPGGVGIS